MLDEIGVMLELATLLSGRLNPNEEQLKAACTKELFAADRANELVKQGYSFRDAYHEVKSYLDELEVGDLAKRLKDKKHLGATGNLGIDRLKKELRKFNLKNW